MVAGLHDSTVKGLADSGERFDGSPLRILIVHARSVPFSPTYYSR